MVMQKMKSTFIPVDCVEKSVSITGTSLLTLKIFMKRKIHVPANFAGKGYRSAPTLRGITEKSMKLLILEENCKEKSYKYIPAISVPINSKGSLI
jgi:hypothetical protein